MPEGPSVVILKDKVQQFAGKKVISVSGNSKINQDRLSGETVTEFRSWGKHFLVCFKGFTVRVHFLMFGSYLIDKEKDRPVRLSIIFENGVINLYSCSIRILEEDLESIYDFSSDVMSEEWDAAKAKKKMKKVPEELVCDILLNQNIFSGVGNIIKNEVLYRIRIHPESKIGKIKNLKINELIKEARIYSFQFYEWKKIFELKKNWLAHTKKICTRCNLPFVRKHTGLTDRRSFFCTNCQKLYA